MAHNKTMKTELTSPCLDKVSHDVGDDVDFLADLE